MSAAMPHPSHLDDDADPCLLACAAGLKMLCAGYLSCCKCAILCSGEASGGSAALPWRGLSAYVSLICIFQVLNLIEAAAEGVKSEASSEGPVELTEGPPPLVKCAALLPLGPSRRPVVLQRTSGKQADSVFQYRAEMSAAKDEEPTPPEVSPTQMSGWCSIINTGVSTSVSPFSYHATLDGMLDTRPVRCGHSVRVCTGLSVAYHQHCVRTICAAKYGNIRPHGNSMRFKAALPDSIVR